MDERTIRICPSMLAADMTYLAAEMQRVQAADMLHVDIMDGVFVPNISFGPMVVAAAKKSTDLPLDIHLMVHDPDIAIDWFTALEPEYLTIHYEASIHLHRSLMKIRDAGCKTGVSLNPHTPVHLIEPVLPYIDMILIMSVNPGFGGQSFIPETIQKLKQARVLVEGTPIRVEVDGGISLENIGNVAAAGADTSVAGTTIFGSIDPNQCIRELRMAAATAKDHE